MMLCFQAVICCDKAGKPEQVIEELRPGQSIELLKELHILTREGKLNQDTRRKLKQVYHLYQFIAPLLEEVSARQSAPTLADHQAASAKGRLSTGGGTPRVDTQAEW